MKVEAGIDIKNGIEISNESKTLSASPHPPNALELYNLILIQVKLM